MSSYDVLKSVNDQLNVKLDEATAEIERLQRLHEVALNERDTACEAHETAVRFNRNLVRMRQDAETLLTKALDLLARAQDGSPKTPREACSHDVLLDYDIGRLLQRAGWLWDAIYRQWRAPADAQPSTLLKDFVCPETVPREALDQAELAAQRLHSQCLAERRRTECEPCALRGRECDNGDHCDECGNRMDGETAAPSDVCHDCWRATKTRLCQEVEFERKLADLAADEAVEPGVW
jgi:hypothetical protein